MNEIKFKINPLSIDYFIDSLKKDKPFMFVKILHGFWEKINNFSPNKSFDEIILDLHKFYEKNNDQQYEISKYLPEEQNDIYENILHGTIRNDDRHYLDVLKMIKSMSNLENFLLGVHYKPWHLSPSCLTEVSRAISAMNQVLPSSLTVYDGHVLKKSCIDGKIIDFWKELHNYHVIVIGLYHLEKINNYFNFKNFNFYGVETSLSLRREQFLKDFSKFHKKLKTKKRKVYLVQFGGSLTAWFGYKSHEFLRDSFFIDMGRSIDIWGDKKTPKQCWVNSIDHKIMKKLLKIKLI